MEMNNSALVTILGMALVTFATRVGGMWTMNRVTITPRVEAWLQALPGALLIAIIAPLILTRGVADAGAALLTALVAWRTKNFIVALVVGVTAVWFFRGML